jgi:hypothetical protein
VRVGSFENEDKCYCPYADSLNYSNAPAGFRNIIWQGSPGTGPDELKEAEPDEYFYRRAIPLTRPMKNSPAFSPAPIFTHPRARTASEIIIN